MYATTAVHLVDALSAHGVPLVMLVGVDICMLLVTIVSLLPASFLCWLKWQWCSHVCPSYAQRIARVA